MVKQSFRDEIEMLLSSKLMSHFVQCHVMCQDCYTGSSVPSGYSGSGFASISGLGSRPSHSMDVTRPAVGDAQRFAALVCLTTLS